MKLFTLLIILCTIMTLTSCEKVMLTDEGVTTEEGEGTASLTISTRGINEDTMEETWIYIFNDNDKCVTKQTIDAINTTATAQLPAGTYTLYAVGGADLSRYTLPTVSNATPTSLITSTVGLEKDDLAMKTEVMTLEDGDEEELEITLERKVFALDKIELKSIPTDVTNVEVTLSSFYNAIKLNGSYDSSTSADYTVNLTKQEDNTTWSCQPQKLMFPSKGIPTITIILTTTSGINSYSFTAEEALAANHHVTISATHNVASGAILTISVNAEEWGANKSIEFDYDETHTVYRPVAGTFCNGYYVVSVDETNRTAVLLAKEKLVEYETPAEGSAASIWRAALTTPMATLGKPINVTNDWRLPTSEEVGIFSKDTQIVTFSSAGNSKIYFCEDDGILKWAQTHHTDIEDNLNWGTTGFIASIRLRPVIDIEY